MLGFFKSFDDEYIELYEYLTQDWRMKPEYVKPFLNNYKKSAGKILFAIKQRSEEYRNSSDAGTRLYALANLGGDADFPNALIAQAYKAYMGDLRRGKNVGGNIEKAIWAILVNRSDLVAAIDRPLAKYVEMAHPEKFPALFEEVFIKSEW